MLRFATVCSGIEAASQAWQPLGWEPVFFSEIEPFPCTVLAHHHGSNLPGEPYARNGTPNYGDMTRFEEWPDHGPSSDRPLDLLAGGTPCQSFSIAGLRKGLDDQRGNLSLTFGAIARRYRPRWLVWENVPGILSSNEGRDFASILGLLAGCRVEPPEGGWKNSGSLEGYERAYGLAWRVLDAQHVRVDGFERAVPQRRRRVVLVGHLGNAARARAVLFERESLSGHPAPRRQAGESVAPTISARSKGGGGLGTDFDLDGGLVANSGDAAYCLTVDGAMSNDAEVETLLAHSLTAGMGASASRMPQEQGALVPVCFDSKGTEVQTSVSGAAPPLRAMAHADSHQNAGGQLAVAYDMRGGEGGAQFEGPHDTANIRAASGGASRSFVAERWAVRRLNPVECERLQGFPDNHTQIPWRGKPADQCPDGHRYKALGNSWAVNVFRWVGRRIEMVEALIAEGLV